MSYFFVVFAYQYFTERDLTIKAIFTYSAIPIVALCILGVNYFITNLFDHSRFIDYFNFAISSILLVVFMRGVVYLYQFRMHVKQHFKMRQNLFFIISFISPILLLIITVLYIANISTFYISVIMPIISIVIYIWGAYRQMLDEIPGLLDHVIDHMRDGILLVNLEYEIIGYNHAVFTEIMDITKCSYLNDFTQGINPMVTKKEILTDIEEAIRNDGDQVFMGDIELLIGQSFHQYNYHISKVKDHNQSIIATMLVFHDITDIHTLYEAIEDKNKQLKTANEQLEEHGKNINALYLEQERKQLLDEINDTLGHSMTEVLALLEVSALMIEKNQSDEEIINILDDSCIRSRDALQEIRESVARYKQ
jgi:signal transduction histidine kinase